MPAGLIAPQQPLAGGREPRLSPDVRPVAARTRSMRDEIIDALPRHDAPPLGTRAIHEKVGIGSKVTVRRLLNELEQEGIAIAIDADDARGARASAKLYRLAAPALIPERTDDDFQDSPEVYGPDETEDEMAL